MTDKNTDRNENVDVDVEWSFEKMKPNGDLVNPDPCPNCGKDTIFNGKTKNWNQWVSSQDIHSIDDGGYECILEVRCGHCWELLYKKKE